MSLNSSSKKHLDQASLPSKALAAVAFQDHLLKDLSIGDLSKTFSAKSSSVSSRLRVHEKRRKLALKNASPTIDTGLKKKKCGQPKVVPDDEIEYVLDTNPRPLTLAQKLGLVPHDKDQEKLLSESEWMTVKKSSENREDFKNPCVICKDDFRMEDQVLLSCSHVFHRACLQAFERFTGRKSCPMCRHASYQTRVVHDGTRVFKHKSATKIQSYWRAYVVRKWYAEIRRTIPPSDPNLRKKYFQQKLSEITDRMVAMTTTDRIDRFLDDIDESVAQSRNVFKFFEQNMLTHLNDEEWTKIEIKAIERDSSECPICLRCLNVPSSFDGSRVFRNTGLDENETSDALALLSCTHVYHATCLNALETFSADYDPIGSNDSHISGDTSQEINILRKPVSFKCPVCRAAYVKRIVLPY